MPELCDELEILRVERIRLITDSTQVYCDCIPGGEIGDRWVPIVPDSPVKNVQIDHQRFICISDADVGVVIGGVHMTEPGYGGTPPVAVLPGIEMGDIDARPRDFSWSIVIGSYQRQVYNAT